MRTVKDVSEHFQGTAVLVEHNGSYYVASHTNVPFSGPETLVFPADADGNVTDWGEVAGGRNMTIDEAIADLGNVIPGRAEGRTMRYITAYGIPGYGPDASDDNYGVHDSWPDVADELKRMLEESADGEGDSAQAYADAGSFRTAWNTRKHADEMYNLAASLDNKRQHAPLYKDNPGLWAETIERIVSENFPYDVTDSVRIYAWESDEFGADDDTDD